MAFNFLFDTFYMDPVPVTIIHLSLKQAANRFDNQEGEDLEVERGLRKAKKREREERGNSKNSTLVSPP